jgi:membrane-associated phospholipid phosphatase
MEKSRVIITLVLFIFLAGSTFSYGQSGLTGSDKTEKTVQDIGDVLQLAIPGAAAISTVVLWDKKGAWQFVKSYGTALALTYVLKYTINKPRPEGATDGHAFPSGHTSSAFSGASFIQRRYGWAYGAPAYALAGFVAYSRLEGYNDRHDGWDVLGGIVIGVGSTYLFTTPYEKEHYELSFSSGEDSYLIGFKYKF